MDMPIVSYSDNSIKLINIKGDIEKIVIELGGIKLYQGGEFEIPKIEESEKPSIFNKLRNLGFAFSSGREWSPSEQFELFREKGLIRGKYICVIWRGVNKPTYVER